MKINEVLNLQHKIIIYGGRFQPMHPGHYAVYKHLTEKFGEQNVWIASSNKTDDYGRPFTFKEKALIATSMFPIPEDRFVFTTSPYRPEEVLRNFDENKDAYITVLSVKDSDRLSGGKYYKPYDDDRELDSFKNHGYVYIVPIMGDNISASQIRDSFKGNNPEQNRELFQKIYKSDNEEIFNLLNDKLSL